MTPYQKRMNSFIQRMAEDMQLRNFSANTIDAYTYHVDKFCQYFGKPADQLGSEEIREFQLYLVNEKKVSWSSFNQAVCLHPKRSTSQLAADFHRALQCSTAALRFVKMTSLGMPSSQRNPHTATAASRAPNLSIDLLSLDRFQYVLSGIARDMPRQADLGKPATYNYATVEYSPFALPPSAPKTLTVDPWSYLTAWLNQQTANTRGANRRRLERALYYANLAESFHKSAEQVALPTRGTLAYYGILNLVKCFLSVRGVELETTYEHHGLSLVQGSRREIQIDGRSTTSVKIFAELAAQLGTPITARSTVSLVQVCAHLPEIHEIAFTLNHLPGNRRKLLPVTIDILSDDTDSWLFSSVKYDLKQRTRVQTNRFLNGDRARYFRDPVECDGCVIHRSQRRKRFTVQNLPSIYRNICNEYNKFNIASLLTADGYRYYCDLANPTLHHLCYSVALMFYIGTAARYRPTEMNDNLNSDLRPLLAEAVSLTPPQILYHLVSMITGSNCCVPRASVAR